MASATGSFLTHQWFAVWRTIQVQRSHINTCMFQVSIYVCLKCQCTISECICHNMYVLIVSILCLNAYMYVFMYMNTVPAACMYCFESGILQDCETPQASHLQNK